MKNVVQKLLTLLLVVLSISSCSLEKTEESCNLLQTEIMGVKAFTDIKKAQLCSKRTKKPILLIFDLHNSSMRKSTDRLAKYLEKEQVESSCIVTFLFVDDKTPLDSVYERNFPNGRSKTISTIGDENMILEIDMCNLLATPYHAIVDYKLELLKEPTGWFSNNKMIKDFLTLDNKK